MGKKAAVENTENLLFSAYIEVSMKKEYDVSNPLDIVVQREESLLLFLDSSLRTVPSPFLEISPSSSLPTTMRLSL